jgi:two-component system invasion response regulator UvrY
MIKLMLVDDHERLRQGLRSKFEACPDIRVAGEAGSAHDLLLHIKTIRPDVMLLDIKLPDGNGISLLSKIKSMLPSCKIVILTMYDHVRYALHALENGAEGYVVKGSAFEELAQAVRDVQQGKTYISSVMAPKLADRLRRKRPESSLDSLSTREFEVFTLLSSGLSVKSAAQQMSLSEKTVTTYLTRIKEKLNLSSKVDLVRIALESGLLE